MEQLVPTTEPLPPTISIPAAKKSVGYLLSDRTKRIRVLVAIGSLLTFHFLWWFADADHIGFAPLFWLLTISLGFKMLRMFHEWYHYVQVSIPVPPQPTGHHFTVDVLTTACPGEPEEMIVRTLRAMQAITYPHTSYLCDEGDDPNLRQICAELGVVHVTRQVKVDAKAGNINNALRQATGELCVVLDPDHVPTPDFLDQVVAYFNDPTVGYVQVVQAYGNQEDSLIAKGAAEQTYHFYGPIMMGMNTYNTAQAIGANCTFRRAALDSIGGHAAGLTEDMHTAMRLHAKGWKSVYAPVIISRGLVPSSLAAYYAQQLKWARGSFELLLNVYPRLFSHWNWRQRLHYLTLPLYFFSGVVTLIDIGVPIAALVLSEFPWHVSLPEFILHLTPVVIISLLIRYNAQRWLREPHEAGLHLTGGLLRIGTWWIYCLGLLYTLLRVRVPYIPTPKEGRGGNEWQLSLPNLVIAGICVAAARYGHYFTQTPYALLMMALALSNAGMLVLIALMAQHHLLDTITKFITTRRPLTALYSSVKQLSEAASTHALRGLRTTAIYSAIFLLIVHSLASMGVAIWQKRTTPSADLIWVRTGTGGVRTGKVLVAKETVVATLTSSTSQSAERATPGVVELRLPRAQFAQVSSTILQQLDAKGSIPMLSWEVENGTFSDTEWQRDVATIRKRNQPVLLRPLINAHNPAAYRATWQRLVTSFRASGDTTAVWVWTPPYPDSLAAYFPGAVYTDWIAADYLTSAAYTTGADQQYLPLRLQLSERVEVNSKPILIITAAQPNQTPLAQAHRITQLYPEVKAVLVGPPPKPQALLSRTKPSSTL